MADNTWGRSSSEDLDAAERPGQKQAAAGVSGSFATERTDTTAPMPAQLRPSENSSASTSAPSAPLAPSALSPTAAARPPLPPASSALASKPMQAASSALPDQLRALASPPSASSSGWSALGATPSAPPVRPTTDHSAARYLPPVAPPQSAQSQSSAQSVPTSPASAAPVLQPQPTTKSGSRWGWRALVSFAAGGLIAASGFGAAQLSRPTETAAGSEPAVVDSALPTTTTPTTVATTSRDSGAVPLVPLDVDEPASFVAQTLGPAVVQIDTELGVGSGVIYGDGLILTNNHVVEGSEAVNVQLADGRHLTGRVIGTDPKTDVGVVSVGPGLDLPRAQLATGEKARVGQIAIAIGSPFDLQQSVTAGIVSAVDRPIPNPERGVVAMIQTDAPINPGNSGGALADRQGRVIGINTSIQTDGLSNANVGVGFAIPIDTAIRVADLLVAGEPIEPGFLGVRGDVPPGGEAGVVLIDVTEGSAAEGAGLLVGDRVVSLNDAPVTGMAELAGLVVANQAGDTVTLEIIRDGELIEISVVLGINDN